MIARKNMNKTDYKNKLVLEIVKEIKEIEEKKALEEKKAKIKQMLSIISEKESKIENLKEEIKNAEKDVAEMKTQLDEEDFSILKNYLFIESEGVVGIGINQPSGFSCTYNSSYNSFFQK